MARAESTVTARPATDLLRRLAPGVALAAAVAVLAVLAEAPLAGAVRAVTGRPILVPSMVIALLVGIALHPVASRKAFAPGMAFCVKRLLRIAVALLGARVAAGDILALGPAVALVVVLAMAATVAAGIALARFFERGDAYGALAGGGPGGRG